MATNPETVVDETPPANNDAAPIDYETEARRLGWVPADEFKGDPSRHVDAETFYNRGQEMMPVLKAQNKSLLKRLEIAEKAAKQAADFFSKAEERAYNRALAEIRAEQEAAVESGDLEAHRRAAKKLDELEKPSAPKVDDISPEQRAEDFADWGKANKWYATNAVMQAYADSQAQIIAKAKGGGFLDREDLGAVSEKVKAKFADEFPDAFGEQSKPARPRSPVEGVTPRPRSGQKTRADLPPEARQTMDKWLRTGIIKSEADYIKSFDFDGWNKAAR